MRYATPLLFGLLCGLLGGCQESPPEPVPEPSSSFVVELSDNDFMEKTRKGVVLLDAYALGCAPCRAMEPHLEKVAETLKDKVMVARINAMTNREFAGYYRVNVFPTLLVFVDGKMVEFSIGARPEKELLELVKKHIILTEPEPVVAAFPENP